MFSKHFALLCLVGSPLETRGCHKISPLKKVFLVAGKKKGKENRRDRRIPFSPKETKPAWIKKFLDKGRRFGPNLGEGKRNENGGEIKTLLPSRDVKSINF